MSTNDRRVARSGRTWEASKAIAPRSQRLRLVLEHLRSHERLTESAGASEDHHRPDFSADEGVRS